MTHNSRDAMRWVALLSTRATMSHGSPVFFLFMLRNSVQAEFVVLVWNCWLCSRDSGYSPCTQMHQPSVHTGRAGSSQGTPDLLRMQRSTPQQTHGGLQIPRSLSLMAYILNSSYLVQVVGLTHQTPNMSLSCLISFCLVKIWHRQQVESINEMMKYSAFGCSFGTLLDGWMSDTPCENTTKDMDRTNQHKLRNNMQ